MISQFEIFRELNTSFGKNSVSADRETDGYLNIP